jgi:hypothetical protein
VLTCHKFDALSGAGELKIQTKAWFGSDASIQIANNVGKTFQLVGTVLPAGQDHYVRPRQVLDHPGGDLPSARIGGWEAGDVLLHYSTNLRQMIRQLFVLTTGDGASELALVDL